MVNADYLKNLNEAQTKAVTYLEGPLLIVAGAGSGKTKVLTSRIAHIIKEKKHTLIKF
jgi:DNA helicase-2/ATP-dependent DNA helicase PcrA